MTVLSIPVLEDDADVLDAALAYAAAGWYVVPVRAGTKNPGSVVGDNWHRQSSRDPHQLAAWFVATDHGIALHCGRSGAVVLDVDDASAFPASLVEHLHAAPFQSTRATDAQRGHYLFATPPGRRLGNSGGRLGAAWGEVRGVNGVIVVAPSRHEDHPEGRYAWKRPGPVPVLPEAIASLLPDAGEVTDAAPDAEVERFLSRHTAGDRPALLEPVLRRFAREVSEGASRHDRAVPAACWAVREAQAGFYPARGAHDALRDAFTALIGTDRDSTAEWAGLWAWAVGQAALSDPARVRAEVEGRTAGPTSGYSLGMASAWAVPPAVVEPEPVEPEAVTSFWDERPVLRHLHDFARAQLCAPWAVLGATLGRVTSATPENVVLPAIVGSYASLNTFVALVGPSGAGKGAAAAVARDALELDGTTLDMVSLGSGEGIAHLFAHREKGEVVRHRWRVLATAPEVDTLVALSGRNGSTLLPQLRAAWSGEAQGFGYADPNKTLPIAEHTYRMGLLLGVQPGKAGPLLDDADGGTPQRFLWMPTLDPGAPDATPPAPAPWLHPTPWPVKPSRRFVLDVPAEARDTIRGARRAQLRGEGDALDGHALLCRLKVAAALALLDGRQAVSSDDWRLSGVVMAKSDRTRAAVAAHLAEHADAANLARGRSEGARAAVAAEVVEDKAVSRVAARLRKHLAEHGEQASADLRRRLASRDRSAYYEDAVAALVAAGQATVTGTGHGQRIALGGGAS